MTVMWTLSSTSDPAAGVAVSPDLVTSYEGERETAAIVLQPIDGPPIVTIPAGTTHARARTGTWSLMFSTWETTRQALALLAGAHSETVFLHRAGDDSIEVLPQRHRHRVLPDELDMHEVTVEWLQLGGVY